MIDWQREKRIAALRERFEDLANMAIERGGDLGIVEALVEIIDEAQQLGLADKCQAMKAALNAWRPAFQA